MKKFVNDFKAFISKGNVVDMAIGVIIGGAFGSIVTSLVNDIMMPIFGKLTGGNDFSQMFYALDGKDYPNLAAAKEATATFAYGSFIQNVVNFLIISFVIFVIISQIAKFKSKIKKPTDEKVTSKICPYCKSEINIEATRCPHCTSELNESIK
ncbi:large conductance mechanosensitive channel [Peptoniphilus koenoeneniae]|uniref:Large-conductance mechanosensitive channel n=1 Tax=Peptoniphilus koenoeneniae TaxID=507751 RepID=A0ABU0AV40_9FIRM|nr:large conductance mechanosensitive channel protein MscL [Peptoniphilus koenoeneniae]MDQ0275084.1 large conductance mechanosensitive channel [Peptoniphilus koenoeneniae]